MQEGLQKGLQEGLQKGLQEGERRGEQRGRLAGEVQLVLRLLNRRVGPLDETLQQQITRLSLEQLEALAEELLDFSTVEELQTWLVQQ